MGSVTRVVAEAYDSYESVPNPSTATYHYGELEIQRSEDYAFLKIALWEMFHNT